MRPAKTFRAPAWLKKIKKSNTQMDIHTSVLVIKTYWKVQRRQGWRLEEAPSPSCCRLTPGRSNGSPIRMGHMTVKTKVCQKACGFNPYTYVCVPFCQSVWLLLGPSLSSFLCVCVCGGWRVYLEALSVSVPSVQTAGLCLSFLSQINQTSRRHFLTSPWPLSCDRSELWLAAGVLGWGGERVSHTK